MNKIPLLLIVSFSFLAGAQFTFIDQQLTWTKGSNQQPTQLGPVGYNWITPYNYVNGDMYLRYEVIDKPSDKTIAIQICAWQDSYRLENCANCFSYSGSRPAVYYFKPKSPADWWKKNGVSLDFTRKFQQVTVIHKDSNCGGQLMQTSMCGAACYPYSDIDQHVPITFKATAIFVSVGGTFAPPANWVDCPVEWGCSREAPLLDTVMIVTPTEVKVVYNEPMDAASVQNKDNYYLSYGIVISSAVLAADRKTVTLTCTELQPNTRYLLKVDNVKDQAGNMIPETLREVIEYTSTGTAADPIALNEQALLSIQPNPVRTGTYCLVTLPDKADRIVILDSRGVMVKNVDCRLKQLVYLDTGLDPGVYITQALTGNSLTRQKVLIVP